jgi:mono/diheme cytochrome c family protein
LAGNTDIKAQDPTQLIQALTNPQIHPFADQLSNEETASVLSYVRSEFGNQAAAICTEQVDAVRPGQ